MVRLIAVVGAGDCSAEEAKIAEEVGRLLAEAGYGVVSGGLGGVMEAACKGCKQAGGTTVGILPGSDRNEANQWVDIRVPTGMEEARNALVAKAGEAMIAVGGEYGTLSEIAFALKLGKTVVGLGSWDLGSDRIVQASSAVEAVKTALASR
ncbi:MAG: TIGR00725 family protein [Armatimonadetes bacterium]|nr:TIGR00725 family protein [Armatimonadota bacterium]